MLGRGGGGVDDGECSERNRIYNSSIGSIICYQTLPMIEDLKVRLYAIRLYHKARI